MITGGDGGGGKFIQGDEIGGGGNDPIGGTGDGGKKLEWCHLYINSFGEFMKVASVKRPVTNNVLPRTRILNCQHLIHKELDILSMQYRMRDLYEV